MANIEEYLQWRKDVPFSVSPFNEVDNLVLAELIYSDFSGVVPENGERISIGEARRRFWALHTREEIKAQATFTKMAPFMMDDMADSPRFGAVEISNYLDVVSVKEDMQLAVAVFWLPDGTAYVAFRGTDSTIVGWKEDFNLSYLPETEGQRRAVLYINQLFQDNETPLRLGGHSKGGNLAVYAAVKAEKAVRDRIMTVYNNDGPGFLSSFTALDAYQEMLPRITCIVPESSIIGTLLSSKASQRVIKSSAQGIFQHDGFSWQVLGNSFVEAEKRSESSLLVETTLRQWLSGRSEEERRQFVQTLFGIFEASGADTFDGIRQDLMNSLNNMRRMMSATPKEQRDIVRDMLKQLAKTGGDHVLQETKKSFFSVLDNFLRSWERDDKPQERLP